MRVALLHYSVPPVIGGVERVLEQHARLLAAAGHEVTVICGAGEAPEVTEDDALPAEGEAKLLQLELAAEEKRWHIEGFAFPSRRRPSPVRLITIPELSPSNPRVKDAQAELSSRKTHEEFTLLREQLARELRPILEAQEIAALHNVCTMPFHIALTEVLWQLAEELSHTRFICWIHDLAAVNPDYSVPATLPWDLLRRTDRRFEYVAVSELRHRQMVQLTGIAPEQCQVIPNGLDPCEELDLSRNVARLTRALDLFERDIVLFQPTRLLRRKNVELSLQVIAALRAQGHDACLLVTGATDPHNSASAAYANRLLSLRQELQLQDVCHFIGEYFEVSDSDISSLYRVADALFFPSHQEGFGLPMLEAALHRIPAFCADVEPISQFPGAVPFAPDSAPQEIASMIIRQTQAWPANSPRKAVVRNYAWSAVYRKCLAPLLNRHKELTHP